jgi:hypothetical protein
MYNDNIKVDLKGIWSEGVCLINMYQNRNKWRAILRTVINLLAA